MRKRFEEDYIKEKARADSLKDLVKDQHTLNEELRNQHDQFFNATKDWIRSEHGGGEKAEGETMNALLQQVIQKLAELGDKQQQLGSDGRRTNSRNKRES